HDFISVILLVARGVSKTPPGSCCYSFFGKKIPKTEIISIAKTHSKCSEKAFVFNTRRGYICVSQTLDWAKKAYEQRQNRDQ
uniref:Chemokine interleukin-8-like domain-containing protein n=1 Tax=Anabas testudineus TaxID=64144 RepID=A0A7N6BZ66_ANATE